LDAVARICGYTVSDRRRMPRQAGWRVLPQERSEGDVCRGVSKGKQKRRDTQSAAMIAATKARKSIGLIGFV